MSMGARAKKWAVIGGIVGVIVLSGLALLRSEWLNNRIVAKLRAEVVRIASPHFTITMGQMNVDLMDGDFSIMDLALSRLEFVG
ncbi:MAG: hypothetical protein IPP33_13195 [Flavobacteriales bacterium]|nr:hypothetical protein [Flavobacteriales bacterium]